MNPKDIITNPENAQFFEENGYCVIDLLDADDAEILKELYHTSNFGKKKKEGFTISLDHVDREEITAIQAKIFEVYSDKLSKHCDNFQMFTASFVVKEPGKKNIVPPHQDWSFVDEKTFFSCTVWTPLLDVNMLNGGLGVIPGSHKLFNHYRSSPSPQSKSPFADHIFTLFPYVKMIDVKAGQALLFDNRLLHASPPNISENTRLGVGVGITSKNAQLKHYYHVPSTNPEMLNEYNVDAEFFITYNNADISKIYDQGLGLDKLNFIRTFERDAPVFDDAELKKRLEALPNATYNHELNDHLAQLFNYNTKEETTMSSKEEKPKKDAENEQSEWKDPRTFWQKYTIKNIIAEIIWRLKGRPDYSKKEK